MAMAACPGYDEYFHIIRVDQIPRQPLQEAQLPAARGLTHSLFRSGPGSKLKWSENASSVGANDRPVHGLHPSGSKSAVDTASNSSPNANRRAQGLRRSA
jgi:hypothetical protein